MAYTGTHDNDTTRGWYATAPEHERDLYRRYVARDGSDVAWDLIRLAWSSVADLAIAPLQDVLDLGTEGPDERARRRRRELALAGPAGQPDGWALGRLTEMTEVYGRAPRGSNQSSASGLPGNGSTSRRKTTGCDSSTAYTIRNQPSTRRYEIGSRAHGTDSLGLPTPGGGFRVAGESL